MGEEAAGGDGGRREYLGMWGCIVFLCKLVCMWVVLCMGICIGVVLSIFI